MGNDTVHFSKKILMIKLKKKIYLPEVFSTSKAQQTRTWSPAGLRTPEVFSTSKAQQTRTWSPAGLCTPEVFSTSKAQQTWTWSPAGLRTPVVFSTSKAQQTRMWSPAGLRTHRFQHIDDNGFEPENKKAHINQNVQVQDLPKPIGVPNVKSSVTRPILMLK